MVFLLVFLLSVRAVYAPWVQVSSVLAGFTGLFVMNHFRTHGWTLGRGTFAQRALLLALYVSSVAVATVLCHVAGI